MSLTNIFLAAAILLTCAAAGATQSPSAQVPCRQGPAPVKVELSAPAGPDARTLPPTSYPTGGKVRVQTVMTNLSSEDMDFTLYDLYYQSRPLLVRDGEVVPYRKEVSELVEQKESNPRLTRIYSYRALDPHKATRIEILELDDWYEPLKPGRYGLTVRYRFEDGRCAPESSKFSFVVVP
jgi:hypothetical protein